MVSIVTTEKNSHLVVAISQDCKGMPLASAIDFGVMKILLLLLLFPIISQRIIDVGRSWRSV